MKANLSRILVLALPATLATLSACSEPRVIPTTPAPTRTSQPAPGPAPVPQVDWREAAITPGDWTWGMVGGKSTARFADGMLQLQCDRAAAAITMSRAGSATTRVPMTVSTSATTRNLTANGGTTTVSIALPARDPLLDAMAFSRGRFAVEVAGLPTVYAPSWPEVSRVIEDCR